MLAQSMDFTVKNTFISTASPSWRPMRTSNSSPGLLDLCNAASNLDGACDFDAERSWTTDREPCSSMQNECERLASEVERLDKENAFLVSVVASNTHDSTNEDGGPDAIGSKNQIKNRVSTGSGRASSVGSTKSGSTSEDDSIESDECDVHNIASDAIALLESKQSMTRVAEENERIASEYRALAEQYRVAASNINAAMTALHGTHGAAVPIPLVQATMMCPGASVPTQVFYVCAPTQPSCFDTSHGVRSSGSSGSGGKISEGTKSSAVSREPSAVVSLPSSSGKTETNRKTSQCKQSEQGDAQHVEKKLANQGKQNKQGDSHNAERKQEHLKSERHTTVMLRQLPNNLTRSNLIGLLDKHGFSGLYDFVYLPVDFNTNAGLGYAFVNLTNNAHAVRLQATFNGFRKWGLPSRKVCSVCWSELSQGLAANIGRYRNSPVMHPGVPDEFKPLLFAEGQRIEFPAASKKVRVPRIRPSHSDATGCVGSQNWCLD